MGFISDRDFLQVIDHNIIIGSKVCRRDMMIANKQQQQTAMSMSMSMAMTMATIKQSARPYEAIIQYENNQPKVRMVFNMHYFFLNRHIPC